MGIQSMVPQGIGGGGNGKQTEGQTGSLSREGSLYRLTLNEVQNHLGDPLGSMNLDEILRSVLPPEAGQNPVMDLQRTGQFGSSSGPQSQGSAEQSRTLKKRTAEEVWLDIERGQSKAGGETRSDPRRLPTLGEMTLEEFLEKEGVAVKETEKKGTSNMISTGSADAPAAGGSGYWMGSHWPQTYYHQHPQQRTMALYAGFGSSAAPAEPVYSDPLLTASPKTGALSDTQTPGSKREASDDLGQKTVGRRQKRMIKNRESAARSRARKQAYTNELENKVSRLEEENRMLKKHRELAKILQSTPAPEPRIRLRRTSSAPF